MTHPLLYTEFCVWLLGYEDLLLHTLVVNNLLLAIGGDNGELALREHTRIVALTLVDGQGAGLVVPMESDSGILAFLVVVVVALVLVESEVAIGTRLNAYLEVIPSLLAYILHIRTEGQDAACTHEHRNTVERGLEGHVLTTCVVLACPEVVPSGSLRQVFRSSLCSGEVDGSIIAAVCSILTIPTCHGIGADDFFLGVLWVHDRGSKDATTKHELIGHVPHLLIVSEVAEQRTHVAVVVRGDLPGGAI